MKKNLVHIHIGMRTVKTAAAVLMAIIIVHFYGVTDSRLVFAMLGAMEAVQPTLSESIESCLTQVIGTLSGAVIGILLLLLPVHPLLITGLGVIAVIVFYNSMRIRYSPILPCMIVVMLCNTPDISPFVYATGRIWDSAIGLGVGMLINTLVFPYDNSRQIRAMATSLQQDLIEFLEDLFDGDGHIPNAADARLKIDTMAGLLRSFSKQKLILHLKRQRTELLAFRMWERKARELLARMEVLSHMDTPGNLTGENLRRLQECGAKISDVRAACTGTEKDIVTNYHIRQILKLHGELLESIQQAN